MTTVLNDPPELVCPRCDGRKHYYALLCHSCTVGTGRYGPPRTPAEVRFWRHVDKAGDCWIWTGGKAYGYGSFYDGETKVYAHRWSYQHHVGPITDGLVIDHLCRQPLCVNPEHLEAVTNRENLRRGDVAWATVHREGTCKRGHERTAENARVNKDGSIHCRVCERERKRVRRAA